MKKLLSLIIGTILICNSSFIIFNSAKADDFEPADEEGNSSNTYILDVDDTGGDITLQFGTSLAETLTWDNANSRFDLSDAFIVDGQLFVNSPTLSDEEIHIGPTSGSSDTAISMENAGNVFEIHVQNNNMFAITNSSETHYLTIDGSTKNMGIGTESGPPIAKLEIDVDNGENTPGIYIDHQETTNDNDGLVIDMAEGGGAPLVIQPLSTSPNTTNEGSVYYDSDDDNLYVYSSGVWVDLTASGGGGGTGTAEYFDAYDSAGATTITASPTYVDIPLGTQRKITTDFTHSAGSAEVTINTSGTYLVHYAVTTDITSGNSRSQTESRLMIDTGGGYGIVPGSIGRMYNREINEGSNTSARNLALDLNAGDKLKIQASRISGTSTIVALANGSALTIARIEGIGADGADGAPGADGADGADGAQGPQGIPGSGSSITLEDEGSTVTNTPHTILDFVGTGVTVTDAGSGEATITISGGSSSDEFEDIYSNDADNTLTTSNGAFTINTGTNDFIVTSNDWGVDASGNITTLGTVDGVNVAAIGVQAHNQNTDTGSSTNTFTLDADNTGGDVILRFGTVLAETLTWDNANTRFTFTDSLRIEGNAAVVGQIYVAGNHAATDSDGTLNLGINGSAWENLAWIDANDQFELSDDLSISQNQIKDVAIDNLASAPGTPVVGQIYHNTADNNTYIYNGTAWEDVTAGGASDGWHGSTTRIKITPMDFQSDDGDDNLDISQNGAYIQESGTASPVATIAIPTGYRAINVMIYGSDTGNAVSIYTNDISNGTTATSLGTGTVGTELNITDTDSTTTNYISIYINVGNNDRIFGGYITITAIP